MTHEGNIYNASKEMKKINVDIMGISEMRWPEAESIEVDDYRVHCSGTQDNTLQNGVGITVNKEIAECVTDSVPFSEKAMLVLIDARPVNLNIIQIHEHTADKLIGMHGLGEQFTW